MTDSSFECGGRVWSLIFEQRPGVQFSPRSKWFVPSLPTNYRTEKNICQLSSRKVA